MDELVLCEVLHHSGALLAHEGDGLHDVHILAQPGAPQELVDGDEYARTATAGTVTMSEELFFFSGA